MKLFSLTACFICLTLSGLVAQDLPLGSWRVHLPYLRGTKVAEAGSRIYCVADKGLFYYDKSTLELGRLSKVDGLSDNEIEQIGYDEKHQVLLIAYSNANVDLLYSDGEIINVQDIKMANITGNSKSINAMLFYDRYAYLSCGFGIVVLDLEKKEIKETYFLGSTGTNPAVYDLTVDDQSIIYAVSDSGVYRASLSNPNLNNFANWTKIYTGSGIFNHLIFFGGELLVNQHVASVSTDSLWRFHSGTWTLFGTSNNSVRRFRNCYGKLLITFSYEVKLFDSQYQQTGSVGQPEYNSIPYTFDALSDRDNIAWIADDQKGLVRYDGSGPATFISPNGPRSELVSGFDAAGDVIWVAHGPVAGGGILQNQYRHGIISSFQNGTWKSLYKENTDNSVCNMDSIYDLTCVVTDPADAGHVYAGSYNRGVMEFSNGDLKALYSKNNSGGVLQYISGTDYIRIGGMALDRDQNLWVASAAVANMLNVKKADGTWKGFSFTGVLKTTDYLGQTLVDDEGQKWCINVNANDQGGIFIFNDHNTIDNTADDQYRLLLDKSGSGGLPSKDVRAMAKDRDGAIWVGTAKGVAVFYSPSAVFSGSSFDAQQILIQYGGYNQYLLETEIVTAIAVDGANRKWFGTQNGGVFLMSADGTKQLANFNTSNSPLLSNNILRIIINREAGEVFFGTDKGIISYRGTATEGGEGCSGTVVYPNPVEENYGGLIAIRGLAANGNVKITDIGGSVIYETKADGGQATWNGYSLNGEKAHTGVYLVWCSDEEGKNTCVTKMVFIN